MGNIEEVFESTYLTLYATPLSSLTPIHGCYTREPYPPPIVYGFKRFETKFRGQMGLQPSRKFLDVLSRLRAKRLCDSCAANALAKHAVS